MDSRTNAEIKKVNRELAKAEMKKIKQEKPGFYALLKQWEKRCAEFTPIQPAPDIYLKLPQQNGRNEPEHGSLKELRNADTHNPKCKII